MREVQDTDLGGYGRGRQMTTEKTYLNTATKINQQGHISIIEYVPSYLTCDPNDKIEAVLMVIYYRAVARKRGQTELRTWGGLLRFLMISRPS